MKILMRADTHYSIGVNNIDDYDQPKHTLMQIVAALAVSMGSMIIGFSSAYTAPALPSLQNSTRFEVTIEEASWIGGLMPLAALAGGVIGGPLVDYIGRRKTILFTALPFLLGWILIGSASMVHFVLAGRALCGLCVGVGSLAFPVYLAEAIHPTVRGTLGLFPTTFGNMGILITYLAGMYFNWSTLAYIGASLSVPFLVLMLMIPETPRWYMLHGRNDEARKALQWLRGKDAKIESELRDIALVDSECEANESNVGEIFSRKYRKSILVSIGLMFIQQLSGINAIIFYSVQIFQMSGSSIGGNLSSIVIGVVNLISTFIATALIDRLGRKILLYFSAVTMTITLILLGTFMYIRDSTTLNVESLGWLPLTCVMIYLLGFSLGFGPIPWLMMGEILPAKIRGPAASICTSFNWLCTFIVTKTFHNLVKAIGSAGTFWMFGCVCFIGLYFVIVFVPETRGKSLEQIEDKLTGRQARTRRLSSIANIKPMPCGC